MRVTIVVAAVLLVLGAAELIYLLVQGPQTAADLCQRAERYSDGAILLRGPVLVAGTTFGNQRLEPNTIKVGDIDIFDFVDKACPAKK